MEPIGSLDLSYTVASCLECGFCFARELPDKKEYSLYYSWLSKYDSAPNLSVIDQHRISSAIKFIESCPIKNDDLIIDVGCGVGAWLASLRDRGYKNLLGFDPAPDASAVAREQFNFGAVHCASIDEFITRQYFEDADLLCFMAVMEHIPDLSNIFEKILNKLKPGAQILVEVPALELFDGNRGEPYGEFSLEHIQYFSVSSLTAFFNRLGAGIVKTSIVPIDGFHTGSLYLLAKVGTAHSTLAIADQMQSDRRLMESYISDSDSRWRETVGRVPTKPFVLYGAGSHSARLLPSLSHSQRLSVLAVIDGNANLQGKSFGRLTIQPPEALRNYPGLPVLVSSFRSETTIASSLSQKFPGNPICLMYH
jgi:SAM-dependent methyltransferase